MRKTSKSVPIRNELINQGIKIGINNRYVIVNKNNPMSKLVRCLLNLEVTILNSFFAITFQETNVTASMTVDHDQVYSRQ